MSDALWLEYRLDALTLAGSRVINFPNSSRMLYNPTDHVIAIETTPAAAAQLRPHVDQELRRIEYSMLVNLPDAKRTLRFFHPMKPGTGVCLADNTRGDLFFFQRNGRPLFSKDYTLRDVSRGEIDSDRDVWQFHGYRHEH